MLAIIQRDSCQFFSFGDKMMLIFVFFMKMIIFVYQLNGFVKASAFFAAYLSA